MPITETAIFAEIVDTFARLTPGCKMDDTDTPTAHQALPELWEKTVRLVIISKGTDRWADPDKGRSYVMHYVKKLAQEVAAKAEEENGKVITHKMIMDVANQRIPEWRQHNEQRNLLLDYCETF
jgi:hypothetical protein